MKPNTLLLALAALCATTLFAFARTAEDETAPSVTDMGWIAGAWSGDMWDGTFDAYYSTAEGGKILSHSKLSKGEKVEFYEFELFEAGHLQPFPGGRPATGLDLVEVDAKARYAVFENPDKDYPTRIRYELLEDDNLVITLSDPHGGSPKTERFDLRR